jgi:hypothetical protein
MNDATLQTPSENSSRALKGRRTRGDHRIGSTPWLLCDALYAIAQAGSWYGTADALLLHLQQRVPRRRQRLQGWPASGEAVSILARQLIDSLQKMGVRLTVYHKQNPACPHIRIVTMASRSVAPPSLKPDEQRPLFTVEDLTECARAAGGKRLR